MKTTAIRQLLCFCVLFAVGGLFASQARAAVTAPVTFSQAADEAAKTLVRVYYAGNGRWRMCDEPECKTKASDWGADALSDTLYFAWKATGNARARAILAKVGRAIPAYPAPCKAKACPYWSDTPAWDAVTLMRVYEVTGDAALIPKASRALQYALSSSAFTLGACSAIPYQRGAASGSAVKTLETGANATKAALLLYRATGNRAYLTAALAQYAADREYYLDPSVPLYTVHVLDDGSACTQVARRFFASVNGDMIWNGLALWHATGQSTFYYDAVDTAEAVDTYLNDDRGIFNDLQGENDVVEPLVDAMNALATQENLSFARAWLLRNARAALGSRSGDGSFSRFFDGPPQADASAWETNGGLALEIAAGALSANGAVAIPQGWASDGYVTAQITSLPATISFTGSGIALVGTMSERCQERHVRVYVDGVETFDRTGLWQNPTMPKGTSVLFAWRWPSSGEHTIVLEPADASELGGGVIDLQGFVAYSSRT